jgi:hypothetical protein
MINKQDNDNIKHKVNLRLDAIKLLDNVNVLDCYHGMGILWNTVKQKTDKKITITGIEKEYGKGDADIYGDAIKVIPNMNLACYNVIDLDSYGLQSLNMLSIIIEKKYKGIVILTVIQSGYGRTNKSIMERIGMPEYYIKNANILISRKLEIIIKKYLYSLGVTEINGYFLGRKNYFYLSI